MVRASITEAKNQLSRYLELVKSGESVLITDRGRAVASIVPVESGASRAESDEARLDRLERQGLIKRGRRGGVRPIPFPKGMKKLSKRNSLSQAIIDERNEERREQGLL